MEKIAREFYLFTFSQVQGGNFFHMSGWWYFHMFRMVMYSQLRSGDIFTTTDLGKRIYHHPRPEKNITILDVREYSCLRPVKKYHTKNKKIKKSWTCENTTTLDLWKYHNPGAYDKHFTADDTRGGTVWWIISIIGTLGWKKTTT